MLQKLLLLSSILFIILTFVGVGYVLLSKGQANAGYAMIPMLFALILSEAYRSKKK